LQLVKIKNLKQIITNCLKIPKMHVLSTEKIIDSPGDLGKGEKLTVYTASWYQKSATNIGKDNSQVVLKEKSPNHLNFTGFLWLSMGFYWMFCVSTNQYESPTWMDYPVAVPLNCRCRPGSITLLKHSKYYSSI